MGTSARQRGYTMIEAMAAAAVFATLSALAHGAYSSYVDRARATKAIADIGIISIEIKKFDTRNGRLPDTLAELNMDPSMLIDPYGTPYRYLNLGNLPGVGGARKDHNNVQLNQDYDLYSAGKNGVTNQTFTSTLSIDDIVRGGEGAFVGTPEEYMRIPSQSRPRSSSGGSLFR